jgi:hypothetical protein
MVKRKKVTRKVTKTKRAATPARSEDRSEILDARGRLGACCHRSFRSFLLAP